MGYSFELPEYLNEKVYLFSITGKYLLECDAKATQFKRVPLARSYFAKKVGDASKIHHDSLTSLAKALIDAQLSKEQRRFLFGTVLPMAVPECLELQLIDQFAEEKREKKDLKTPKLTKIITA
jgi:hypothetical protein